MTTKMIQVKHKLLEEKLAAALSTMELSNAVKEIREEIKELQDECPHTNDDGSFALVNERCCFCGKKVRV